MKTPKEIADECMKGFRTPVDCEVNPWTKIEVAIVLRDNEYIQWIKANAKVCGCSDRILEDLKK